MLPGAIATWLAAAGWTNLAVVVAGIGLSHVVGAALIVNGIMQARRAKKDARRAYESSLRDRIMTIQSAVSPHTVVYGRARVGGTIIRKPFSSGTYSEYLHVQMVIGAHEFDAIEDIWFNDESIGSLDGSGWVQTGSRYYKSQSIPYQESKTIASGSITLAHAPDAILTVVAYGGDQQVAVPYTWTSGTSVTFDAGYNGTTVEVTYRYTTGTAYVRVQKYLGIAAGERDTALEAIDAEWLTTHVGKGRPRLHITLRYDPEMFPTGLPLITAIVRGKKIYDPRLDTTAGGSGSHRTADPSTWAWSQNPSLIARDYITSDAGFGEAHSSIDDAAVMTAANICDESVQVASVTYEDRYVCDGVLYTSEDRLTNLQAIASSMAGTCVYSGGKWIIRAGAYVSPVMSLDDDSIAPGSIELMTETPQRDVFNAVRGKIIDPDRKWQEVDFPPYESATYATEDGETIWTDIILPMTNHAGRAQMIGKQILHRSRQALAFKATHFLEAARLQPGDTANLSIEFFGWTNKVFRVVDRKLRFPSGVEITWQEEASAVYSWAYTEALNYDPAPNTGFPEPWFVSALAGLTVTSGASYYRTLNDGSRQSFMRISWTAHADPGVLTGGSIEVYVKRAIDSVYQKILLDGDQTRLDYDVATGEIYTIAVRAWNGVAFSAYAYATHTAGSAPVNLPASGSVTSDQIADGAVDLAAFGASLRPVQIVASLPALPNASYPGGAVVFLTSDNSLYRSTGTAWTGAVAASVITGQLSDAQISALAASKLTGQITSTQITDDAITTPKLAAGAVTTAEIAANTITAGNIAASAIGTDELAAGAVTANKIAAATITATEIAANTITSGKIQAGAITSTLMAAGSITAANAAIADLTVGTVKIAGEAVTAPRSAYTDAETTVGATATSVVSCAVPSGATNVLIQASCLYRDSDLSTTTTTVTFTLRKDGSVLQTRAVDMDTSKNVLTIEYVDTSPSGTNYQLYAAASASDDMFVGKRFISAFATKGK